jgi:holin-like protein
MIEALAFLLLAQLAGEAFVRGLGLPIPGPVIGLILLALILARRGTPANLRETSLGLLRNLSLLFVPAGVGVINQARVLADYWLPLSVALVVSTLATLAVTALTFRFVQKRLGGTDRGDAA